ncbi:MAG: 1-acyl-sn-glycerol-3-phosphate acyltransferase [Gammaproteobacteria bacterium]|nr:1-acyl-sn-glycerol-3-phosphate acyltransferase [Gammaproteobacteria bacterium]
MDSTITLPIWLFILITVFAAIMVLDRFLMPSMRWYFRRRVNRVIDEINTRLDVEIRPLQITQRKALIDRLVFDEKVLEAVKQTAQEKGMPTAVAQDRARSFAREIVPAFNAYMYFRIGYWIAKRLARLTYRMRLGFYDNNELSKVDPESAVVFVMNHRSNMDYILVSFLVAEKTALSYAVGEWARIWPLQTLIRSMGAFFVRRNSGDRLYRRVLERYVNMATRAGVCQAVFLEGGLSKDGALREPKLGFLDYMLRDYHSDTDRDITFIPVGINYDRVLEDRTLVRNLDKTATKRSIWFVLRTTFRFVLKTLLLSRKTRLRRFGYASVNLGNPISARAYCANNNVEFIHIEQEKRFEKTAELADVLMTQVKEAIPIIPVALMSEIVLANRDRWRSALELKALALQRMDALKKMGAPIRISSTTTESVLSSALDIIEGREWLDVQDSLYKARPDAIVILEYYANSIAHWPQPELRVTPDVE